MTSNELMNKIREILPNATIGEENDGQIVIYTNLEEINNRLIDFDESYGIDDVKIMLLAQNLAQEFNQITFEFEIDKEIPL